MMHIMILGDMASGGVIIAGVLVTMVFIAGVLGVVAALIIKTIRSNKDHDKGDES